MTHPQHALVALDARHVPACVDVAATVGWKPPVETWHWMLGMGEGWGIDHAGALAGAVILFQFDDALAMVAMMMVRPDAQRMGIGRALLEQVDRRVSPQTTTALYASAEGERLYRPYGYVDAGASHRYEGAPRTLTVDENPALRRARATDIAAMVALDARAQGGARAKLIRSSAERAERAFVVERHGTIEAFGLAGQEDGARRLGPIVAPRDDDAVAIASSLAEGAARVRVDLEPGERALAAWVQRAGLDATVVSPRLVRGRGAMPGARAWIRTLAGRPFG
ncbi:MAG: GNAT family N-acetyltransferase [Polyangiaceae bacterium]|nr:GNAT family N-acetyltransferase [Polyangiaceae bacterium]